MKFKPSVAHDGGRGIIWRAFIDVFWFLYDNDAKSAELRMREALNTLRCGHSFPLAYSDKIHKNQRRTPISELSGDKVANSEATKGRTASAAVASKPSGHVECTSNVSFEDDTLIVRPTKKRKKEKRSRDKKLAELAEERVQSNLPVKVKPTQLPVSTTISSNMKGSGLMKEYTHPEAMKVEKRMKKKKKKKQMNGEGVSAVRIMIKARYWKCTSRPFSRILLTKRSYQSFGLVKIPGLRQPRMTLDTRTASH